MNLPLAPTCMFVLAFRSSKLIHVLNWLYKDRVDGTSLKICSFFFLFALELDISLWPYHLECARSCLESDIIDFNKLVTTDCIRLNALYYQLRKLEHETCTILPGCLSDGKIPHAWSQPQMYLVVLPQVWARKQAPCIKFISLIIILCTDTGGRHCSWI